MKLLQYAQYQLQARKKEWSTYGQALIKRRPTPAQQKFVLFAHYRTGSTLLASLLNCHPDINCDGEIFLKFVDLKAKLIFWPYLYLEGHYQQSNCEVYGCDIKLDQLHKIRANPGRFMQTIHDRGWKIIHLKRQNILRIYISNQLAQHRQQWHLYNDEKGEPTKINIDITRFFYSLAWTEDLMAQEEKIFEKIPHLKVVYEDDLLNSENHQATLDKVFDYLELPSIPVKTNMQRTSSKNLSDSIENYEQFVTAIKKTKYAKYLDLQT